jgi:hypothetical protein
MADPTAASVAIISGNRNIIVEENPHRQAVRNLLHGHELLKCTLDDGRIATGALVCIDRL